jgi:FxsC-like protein
MANYWFFLSYARADRDPYLKKFVKTLSDTIRMRTGDTNANIGFFDGDDIEVGSAWPAALEGGLQGSKIFLPLYTPTYFTKEYCGKEWAIFRSRLEPTRQATNALPPVMIPVLWQPENVLPTPLPDAVSEVQYKHNDFGDVYAAEGLRQIMSLNKYRDRYKEFVVDLADKIIATAKTYGNIPPLPVVPPIKTVPSAFSPPPPAPVAIPPGIAPPVVAAQPSAPAPATGGPRYVQFIFVAGKRSEFIPPRDQYYGNDGPDWQPYLPDLQDEVAILAQDIASREKLRYEVVSFDADIEKKIRQADLDNKIIVVVLDTWTLQLQPYQNWLQQLDNIESKNCILLIPWNPKDADTVANRDTLEGILEGTFPNKTTPKDPNLFIDWVNSPDDLTTALREALFKAQSRIIEKNQKRRIIAGPRVPLATITGPGETTNA